MADRTSGQCASPPMTGIMGLRSPRTGTPLHAVCFGLSQSHSHVRVIRTVATGMHQLARILIGYTNGSAFRVASDRYFSTYTYILRLMDPRRMTTEFRTLR